MNFKSIKIRQIFFNLIENIENMLGLKCFENIHRHFYP